MEAETSMYIQKMSVYPVSMEPGGMEHSRSSSLNRQLIMYYKMLWPHHSLRDEEGAAVQNDIDFPTVKFCKFQNFPQNQIEYLR